MLFKMIISMNFSYVVGKCTLRLVCTSGIYVGMCVEVWQRKINVNTLQVHVLSILSSCKFTLYITKYIDDEKL